MEEVVGPGQPVGHVGSRVMAAAVGLGLPPAMMVPGAWWELLARVCRRPCCFPGHGGNCGPGAAGRQCWFPGHGGSCGPGSDGQPCWFPGHVKSCGPGPARRPCLFPGRGGSIELRAARRTCSFPEHGGSCGPGAAGRPCWFLGHGAICGPKGLAGHVVSRVMAEPVGLGLLGGHDGFRGIEGAVSPRLPVAMLVPRAWRELWAWGCR